MKILIVSLAFVALTGCLKTRSEVKETDQRQVIQQQVVSLQKTNADAGNRFSELEEQVRLINGRTEVLENRLAVETKETDKEKKTFQEQNTELNRKFALLQDSVSKMDQQLNQMTAELAAMHAQIAAHQAEKSAAAATAAASKKNPYEQAQDLFADKEWKRAILNYEKYRQESPKGKNFADATYKIGVSFQELGMKDEARTFFDEVISKHPNSEEARRAKIRLKGLKK